jgi:LPXTG-site transpeptidase (sortase) family protein
LQNLIDGKSVEAIWGITFPKQPSLPAGQAGAGLPIRLKIPKININIALESVGLTPQGAVDVPKDPANAAWFNLGSRPGDNGSAVITGHYGWWKDGTSGIFNNLSKLKKGDKIYVQDDKGTIITFVISEFQTYDPNADVPEVFNSNDGKVHLNLITCEGVWNKSAKQYSKRLVVFADKEEVNSSNLIAFAGVMSAASAPAVVTPAPAAPAACTTAATFTKFLSFGSTQKQVRQLQNLLQCLGYFPADVAPTGYFGQATEDSVKKFQSANGIEAAGYVGPATRSALNHYVVMK